jgi:regulator of cell morphogenesis and NO signaling
MKRENLGLLSLGEIVTNDFRTASVFKEVGIDFCCGGKTNLQQACEDKGLDTAVVIERLDALSHAPVNPSQNFNEWELGFLADYIVNTHHRYVLKALPELVFYTQKIASVHGSHHVELLEVADLFSQVDKELRQHLQNEEEVLFPSVKKMLAEPSDEIRNLLSSTVLRMNSEHEFAGGSMDKINVLTRQYAVPDDACNTYRVALKMLEQFEDDLHIHVHLENNILFPKALLL